MFQILRLAMLKSQCVIDGDGIACEHLDHVIGFPNPPQIVRAPLTGPEVGIQLGFFSVTVRALIVWILNAQIMDKINQGYGLSFVSLGKGPFPAEVKQPKKQTVKA